MKLLFLITIISFGVFGFTSINPNGTNDSPTTFIQEENHQIDVPENVQAILDRSCLPCHGEDGSGKAKMKWNYEKMPDYSKSKLISKLVKITDKVEDGKMPPPKNVKKNPDRNLSDGDKKIIMQWADDSAEKMAGSAK